MPAKPHAEIAGAGFAGLVVGTALAERGWSVRVHERDRELRAFGAGIFIWNNGLRVLRAIGAYDAVVAAAHEAGVYEDRHENRVTSRTEFGPSNGIRLLTMTRQSLYAPILASAERSGVDIVTGSEIVSASPEGTLFDANGREFRAHLAIGADGVGSKVRDSLGLRTERDTGKHGIIRVLAPRCLHALGPGNWNDVIDFYNLPVRSLRILYVPCNDNELYLAMMAPLDDPEASAIPPRVDVWLEAFPQLAPVIEGIDATGRFDAYETSKVRTWSVGKVALVGDSAHAMVPSLAQGAGLAICNALSLAVTLSNASDIERSLAQWESAQRPLTEHTQDAAARVSRERLINRNPIWNDDTLRAARSIPNGTQHLPIP